MAPRAEYLEALEDIKAEESGIELTQRSPYVFTMGGRWTAKEVRKRLKTQMAARDDWDWGEWRIAERRVDGGSELEVWYVGPRDAVKAG